jgi:DNA-binding MarR family transcriptional regulator
MPMLPNALLLPDLLARAHREVYADLSRALADKDGLPVEQWRVLSILSERDGLSMSELSEKAFMNISALSKTVDRMVFRAIVHRRQDSEDQRRVLIYITSFGGDLLRSSAPVVERFCSELSDALGPKRSRQLENLLRSILAARAN